MKKIKLTGAQKTALFLLSIDDKYIFENIWNEFDEKEQEKIIEAIAYVNRMGKINSKVYDYITYEFALFDEMLSKLNYEEKEYIISEIKHSSKMDVISKYNFINEVIKLKENYIKGDR